jgi:hypothetical protein
MAESLANVDILGIEFNHDVHMQLGSGRSRALIARNLGDRGHLSNKQAAELVRCVLRRSRRDRVAHLVLLHLSEQCNRPELAIHEAREAVESTGRRVLIHAARQAPAHPNLQISPCQPSAASASKGMPQSRTMEPAKVRSATMMLPGLEMENRLDIGVELEDRPEAPS